ncbi:MAG: hypothetical protein WC838_07280, partial [Candidatus Margulisiibacteriota bacterium]
MFRRPPATILAVHANNISNLASELSSANSKNLIDLALANELCLYLILDKNVNKQEISDILFDHFAESSDKICYQTRLTGQGLELAAMKQADLADLLSQFPRGHPRLGRIYPELCPGLAFYPRPRVLWSQLLVALLIVTLLNIAFLALNNYSLESSQRAMLNEDLSLVAQNQTTGTLPKTASLTLETLSQLIKQVSTPKPPEVFLKEIGLSADRSNISGYSKGGNVERLILYEIGRAH